MESATALFLLLLVCVCSCAHAASVLRTLAEKKGIYIGSAANYGYMNSDSQYKTVLGQQYNLVTPENEMKWSATEPSRGTFTYTQGDAIVAFAKQNSQTVRGHNLVWGQYNPSWLTSGNFNAATLQSILQNHITNVAGHYKGEVYCWDVVNEAIADSPTSTNYLKSTVWYPAIPNYIDLAFQWAHAADPNAKLFYNDYSTEGSGAKSDAVYNMVKTMKAAGIPIHGVGLQMHVSLGYSPSVADITANIKRLVALGLEVHITEMDVSINGGSGTQANMFSAQATIYRNVLQACLSVSGCKAFVTWGFTDKYTWLGSSAYPLPFNATYATKPAFDALVADLS